MKDFLSYELLVHVFNMTLAAGVVILFVLAARLVLRRAPKVFSYVLWSVVLFRLLCPFSLPAGFSLLSLTNAPTSEAASQATQVQYLQPDLVHQEFPQVQLPIPGVGEVITQALPRGEEQLAADPLEAPMALLTMAWLGGIVLIAGYSLCSLLRLRRHLVGAAPLRDNIFLADHISSPFVLGLLRPRIYLPSSLSAGEQAYIILHEQHHIRRLDHLWKVLAFLALCIHWFNPLVWLAFFLSQKDMEMSCDEAVLQKLGPQIRSDYSSSLLSLSTGRRILGGTPLAFGEGDVRNRIRNLLSWRRPSKWAAALAALVCLCVVAACGTNPEAEEPAESQQTPAFSHADEEEGEEYAPLSILSGYLGQLQEGDGLTLSLTRKGEDPVIYDDCWSVINAAYYLLSLQNAQWLEAEALTPGFSPEQSTSCVTIAQINDWSLTAYVDSDEVHFKGPTGEIWLTSQDDSFVPYQQLRGWFDEVEYAALGGDESNQSRIVIPNEGQNYLEAAAVFSQTVESFHLQASPGSKFCYSYVSTQVEAAEDAAAHFREQGEIGENTYCFYLTTVFVPENDLALSWSMAGNTGEYTGSDPAVPEGAFEYLRCGYITLEKDGWHGELVGTGF